MKNILHKTNLFIRSLLFSIIIVITPIFWFFVILMSFPFPLRVRYGLVILWANAMVWTLKVICKIDYKIEGAENIDPKHNAVVLCKHQSTLETLMMPGLLNGPAIIMKREILRLPFFGWGAALTAPIWINRGDTRSAMQQINDQGTYWLKKGRFVLIFPEGTRVPYGEVGKYRLGGARLAVSAGYPVIPIAHNAGKFWPRRKFIKQPGTMHMIIGKPIETKNRKPEEVMEEVKSWIEGQNL
jgi:1-acyl-sn-glycerol-3-phosphate acyltransferase